MSASLQNGSSSECASKLQYALERRTFVARNRLIRLLFGRSLFTRHIGSADTAMQLRCRRDLARDHIDMGPCRIITTSRLKE